MATRKKKNVANTVPTTQWPGINSDPVTQGYVAQLRAQRPKPIVKRG